MTTGPPAAAQTGPHKDSSVHHAGLALGEAQGVLILLHGRGGSAEDILALGRAIGMPNLAYLAPAASGSTWYPNSFLAPRASNEPWLSSALKKIESILETAAAAGLTSERILIAGFSQGACLATEFVASHPARYGGLLAFTGGLIGAPGELPSYTGDLAGMPALLASGDPDPHVPWTRVEESAERLTAMHAVVTLRRYPGRPHTVSAAEVELGREFIVKALNHLPPRQA